MLLSAIVEKVRVAVGDGGGVYIKSDYVVDWVNEAIRDIFRKTQIGRDKKITWTLPAGTSQYAPADEIYKVHYIATPQLKLEEMLYETILDQYGWEFLNLNEHPRYFWRGYEAGKTVVNFAPVPTTDIELTLSLTFFPSELTDTDDTTDLLPSSYVDDIIRFCVMRAQERNKDFRASEKAEQQYNGNMAERVSESQKVDDDYASFTPDPFDYV